MSEPAFEHHLSRLFAASPPLGDEAAFATAVQGRLERGWALRRILIGVAGGIGGLLTAAQVVSANLVERVTQASQSADARAHNLLSEFVTRGQTALHLHSLPIGGEALWMAGGLAALGVGLAAARLMERF